MEFEWVFFRLLFGPPNENAGISKAADYLTRSVRRASGFVLADYREVVRLWRIRVAMAQTSRCGH
jgi:hypothetical protein